MQKQSSNDLEKGAALPSDGLDASRNGPLARPRPLNGQALWPCKPARTTALPTPYSSARLETALGQRAKVSHLRPHVRTRDELSGSASPFLRRASSHDRWSRLISLDGDGFVNDFAGSVPVVPISTRINQNSRQVRPNLLPTRSVANAGERQRRQRSSSNDLRPVVLVGSHNGRWGSLTPFVQMPVIRTFTRRLWSLPCWRKASARSHFAWMSASPPVANSSPELLSNIWLFPNGKRSSTW